MIFILTLSQNNGVVALGCLCELTSVVVAPPPLLRLEVTHKSAFAKDEHGGYQENRAGGARQVTSRNHEGARQGRSGAP